MRITKVLPALAVAAALSLSGCGGGNSAEGAAGSGVSLPEDKEMSASISYGIWDSVQRPAMEQLIEDFNKEYPNIKVNITLTPFDQYFTKLQTQAAGGELPDVFWMNGPNVQLYASEGMLEPLTSLIDSDAIDPANYPSAMNDLYTFEDSMYAVPKDFDTIGLWYNTRLFEEAGVEIPTEDWTWEDFHQAAKTISEKLGSQGVYGFAGGSANQALMYNAIFQAGGEVISSDGKTSGYDSPEAQSAFQLFADMIKDGSSPSIQVTTENKVFDLFSSEKAAMVWDGNWRVNTYAQSPNMANFQVTHLPRGERQATVIHGIGNAMSAKTDEKEAAAAFLTYLSGKEAALTQAEMRAANPAYAGTQEAFLQSVPEFHLEVFHEAADQYAYPYPVSKNTSAWLAEEGKYYPRILSGELSVEEGTSQLADAMNKHLASEK